MASLEGPGPLQPLSRAAFDGSRLGKLYLDNADGARIVDALDALFAAYAQDRQAGERSDDWTVRAGHVARTKSGRTFHDGAGALRQLAA